MPAQGTKTIRCAHGFPEPSSLEPKSQKAGLTHLGCLAPLGLQEHRSRAPRWSRHQGKTMACSHPSCSLLVHSPWYSVPWVMQASKRAPLPAVQSNTEAILYSCSKAAQNWMGLLSCQKSGTALSRKRSSSHLGCWLPEHWGRRSALSPAWA